MTERERFETAMLKHGMSGSDFKRALSQGYTYSWSGTEQAFNAFKEGLAASAPKVQMTDAEISAIFAKTFGYVNSLQLAGGPLRFARAIAARSAPNTELVAALKEIAMYRSNDWSGIQARAALAAVGEA